MFIFCFKGVCMKFILLLVFITNLFFGQIFSGEIFLKEDDLSEISTQDVLDIADKLRSQVLFITFFYSKINVLEDMDDLYDLEDFDDCESAIHVFYKLYPDKIFCENTFKKIEAYLCLASILNFTDDVISKLLRDDDEAFSADELLYNYNYIFTVAIDQLTVPVNIDEDVYNWYMSMAFNSDEEFSISIDSFYEIIDFFRFVLDEIIQKHFSIFLLFTASKSKLELVDLVFSSRTLFPDLDFTSFTRDFRRMCFLKQSEVCCEDIMIDILCDI